MPKRIQRKRTKGWRMPEGAVYVGRPTKWGNRYKVGDPMGTHDKKGTYCERPMTAKDAVTFYRAEMELFCGNRLNIEELRGKDLACWCPLDQPCHADVLLELANA